MGFLASPDTSPKSSMDYGLWIMDMEANIDRQHIISRLLFSLTAVRLQLTLTLSLSLLFTPAANLWNNTTGRNTTQHTTWTCGMGCLRGRSNKTHIPLIFFCCYDTGYVCIMRTEYSTVQRYQWVRIEQPASIMDPFSSSISLHFPSSSSAHQQNGA